MLLGEPEEVRGLAVHKTEIAGSQTSIVAFVDQHELGARGKLGKASLRQLLPDDAGTIRRKESNIIVRDDSVPRRGNAVQPGGQDEPSPDHGPRMANHAAG